MFETFLVVVTQIIAMVFMMLVGYVLSKKGQLTEAGTAQMSTIVLYVAGPALSILSFATDFTPERLHDALTCFVLAALITTIFAVVSHLIFGPDTVARFASIFTNSGFIGIPLIVSLLGVEYVFYVSMIHAGIFFLLWTYGVWLISQNKDDISIKSTLTNPALFSLLIGFVLFLGSVHLIPVAESTLDGLGNLNTGLAMLILGSFLARSELGHMIRSFKMYKLSLIRLVVLPLIAIAVLWLIPGLSLEVKQVMLIITACPSGAMVVMFCERFGKPGETAAGYVALSTLLSVLTLPIIVALGTAVLM